MRHKANRGHLMASKTGKRRRLLGKPTQVAAVDAKTIRRMLAMQ